MSMYSDQEDYEDYENEEYYEDEYSDEDEYSMYSDEDENPIYYISDSENSEDDSVPPYDVLNWSTRMSGREMRVFSDSKTFTRLSKKNKENDEEKTFKKNKENDEENDEEKTFNWGNLTKEIKREKREKREEEEAYLESPDTIAKFLKDKVEKKKTFYHIIPKSTEEIYKIDSEHDLTTKYGIYCFRYRDNSDKTYICFLQTDLKYAAFTQHWPFNVKNNDENKVTLSVIPNIVGTAGSMELKYKVTFTTININEKYEKIKNKWDKKIEEDRRENKEEIVVAYKKVKKTYKPPLRFAHRRNGGGKKKVTHTESSTTVEERRRRKRNAKKKQKKEEESKRQEYFKNKPTSNDVETNNNNYVEIYVNLEETDDELSEEEQKIKNEYDQEQKKKINEIYSAMNIDKMFENNSEQIRKVTKSEKRRKRREESKREVKKKVNLDPKRIFKFDEYQSKKIRTNNAKASFCKSVINGYKCRFGTNCRFAHNIDELNPFECKFGIECCLRSDSSCVYIHPDETKELYCKRHDIRIIKKEICKSVTFGFTCKFGDNCRFSHEKQETKETKEKKICCEIRASETRAELRSAKRKFIPAVPPPKTCWSQKKEDFSENMSIPELISESENETKEKKICKSVIFGFTCKFGDNCRFSHEKQETKETKEKKICKSVIFGFTCKFGDNCRFSHEKQETKEKEICKSVRFGFPCKFGDNCRFSHEKQETKEKEEKEICCEIKRKFIPSVPPQKTCWSQKKEDFSENMHMPESSSESENTLKKEIKKTVKSTPDQTVIMAVSHEICKKTLVMLLENGCKNIKFIL